MAPEYALHGHLSTKSDVYSFGITLLEIASGRKIFDITLDGRMLIQHVRIILAYIVTITVICRGFSKLISQFNFLFGV